MMTLIYVQNVQKVFLKTMMNKQKVERLIYTFLIITLFFVGVFIGSHDKKIKLCSENNSYLVTVEGVEGCLVYHGEYCQNAFGDIEEMFPKLDVKINGSSSSWSK